MYIVYFLHNMYALISYVNLLRHLCVAWDV